MIVVSDTSPISGLIIINRLDILHKTYGQVIIPDTVYKELSSLQRFGFDISILQNEKWFSIQKPSNITLVIKLTSESVATY